MQEGDAIHTPPRTHKTDRLPPRRAMMALFAGLWGGTRVTKAAAGYNDEPAKLPALHGLERQSVLHLDAAAGGAAWSPDGAQLAAYSDFGRVITLWNSNGTQRGELHRQVAYNGNSLAFLPGSLSLVTPAINDAGVLRGTALTVWDLNASVPVREVAGPAPERPVQFNRALAFALAPQGDVLAAITSPLPGQPITLYDTATWSKAAALLLPGSDSGLSITISPDGATIAVGTVQGRVVLFDRHRLGAKPRLLTCFAPPPTIGVESLSFSPDGKLLAVGAGLVIGPPSAGSQLTLLAIVRVADGSRVAGLTGGFAPVRDVSWSADGHAVAVAAGDHTLRVLGLPAAGEGRTIAHAELGGAVTAARFAPTGRRLAVASGNNVFVFELRD